MRTPVIVGIVLLALFVPVVAVGQALPNVNLTRVLYNARRTTVNPQGELKAQIDAVDQAIAAATKLGQVSEVRRQIAKGLTLLDGKPWTPALDFQTSLALRTETTVADSSAPYSVRLEQIYHPAIDLSPALSVQMRLKKRAAAAAGTTGPSTLTLVRDLGTFDGLSRDLSESPFGMDLDVTGVADDSYVLEADVMADGASLATTSLPIVLLKGLDARLRALDTAAASLAPAVRADVSYPSDYIRKVNRGRVGLGTFVVGPELAAAEAVASAAKGGRDPFKGKTGDFERHYTLAGANEVMPYRVYVPTGYKAATPTALVIALHGLGATEDSFFDSYSKLPPKLAEQHGFLMAAPLGYRVDGFYGSPLMGASDVASKRRIEYSEKDVLEVVTLMRAQYNVDPSRIYLIGHSMGAVGTWALAAKYPDLWAALVPFSGVGSPALAERMKAIPQFVVHGDADNTVNVSGSRTMVAALTKLGARVTYVEVPGGSHIDVVVPNLPKAFEFLAGQRRGPQPTSQQ
jgi:predicted esterase